MKMATPKNYKFTVFWRTLPYEGIAYIAYMHGRDFFKIVWPKKIEYD